MYHAISCLREKTIFFVLHSNPLLYHINSSIKYVSQHSKQAKNKRPFSPRKIAIAVGKDSWVLWRF